MAKILVQRQWPTGDVLTISISVDDSFPDVVAEARHAAVTAFEAALEISMAYDDLDDDADTV